MSRFSTVFALCLTLAGCGGPQPMGPTTASDQSEDSLQRRRHCTNNSDCREIEFCDTEGQASCSSIGVCTPRGINLFCAQIFIGVCGCDGQTYANDCLMHKAGVSKAYDGKCETPACHSNDDCGELEYCEFATGECGGDGACSSRGANLFCVQTYTPVCGCDGVTYTNSCYAKKAGQSIASDGECAN